MLAGLPAGLLWWIIAPLPPIEKRADGLYRAGGEGNESAIAADGWFAVIVIAVGIVVALLVYLRTRPSRLAPLVGLAIGGVLGSVVAWKFGALLGPDSLTETAKGVKVGGRFDGPLTVSAYGVLLAWPMSAVITYFAVSAGAETSEHVAGPPPAAQALPPVDDGPAHGPEETSPEGDRPVGDVAVSPPDGSAPSEHR